ncbi:MAG: hypothetical protein QG673_2290 [Pseudomonadota bacterium]|nr:hypothetical protein [Pseudomonadota bacterium]
MLHASPILLHLVSKSHQPAVNKLLDITKGIIEELHQKQFDLVASIVNKNVSSKEFNVYGAIRSIIRYALLTRNGSKITVDAYAEQSALGFTKDEESFILDSISSEYVIFHPKSLRNIIAGTVFHELTGLK